MEEDAGDGEVVAEDVVVVVDNVVVDVVVELVVVDDVVDVEFVCAETMKLVFQLKQHRIILRVKTRRYSFIFFTELKYLVWSFKTLFFVKGYLSTCILKLIQSFSKPCIVHS